MLKRLTAEYRDRAEGRLLKSPKLDRDRVSNDLEKKIRNDNIADATVRKDESGVTIVLEDVRFPPYSAELDDAEKNKRTRIAEMLKQYPERDFLVTGHTARVGKEKTSQILSEQRAMAVADFLISKGACEKTRIVTRDKGSREQRRPKAQPACGDNNIGKLKCMRFVKNCHNFFEKIMKH